MTEPHSFGAWLRRERERRAVTLRMIADQTKIGARRLEALERGDISQWPGGIYRRAFVRAYADAIGLDADLVLSNFERAFPSDASAPLSPADVVGPSIEGAEMRLALATPAVAGVTTSVIKKAIRDLSCVMVFGLAGFAAAGALGFWAAAAVAAVVFHVLNVLGLNQRTWWPRSVDQPRPVEQPAAALDTRAEVLSFSDLSAASSAAFPQRRRAVRS